MIKKYVNLFKFKEELNLLPNNNIKIRLKGSKYSCQTGVIVQKRSIFNPK